MGLDAASVMEGAGDQDGLNEGELGSNARQAEAIPLSVVEPHSSSSQELDASEMKDVHLGIFRTTVETSWRSDLREAMWKNSTLSNKKRQEYFSWADEMLKVGRIEPTSPDKTVQFNPVQVVVKESKKLRITHDFREINKHSSKFSYQQEHIDDLHAWLSEQPYFVQFDGKKAFHSITVDPEQRKFLGFVLPDGRKYRFTAMPMGITNGPCLFSEWMYLQLRQMQPHLRKLVRFYQDDVLVAGSDEAEVIRASLEARTILEERGFVVNQDKSSWEPTTPKVVLGAVWSPSRLEPNEELWVKIQYAWRRWKTCRGLQNFKKVEGLVVAGLAFGGTFAELHYLLKRGRERIIDWKLKRSYAEVVALRGSDVYIYTDACETGFGWVCRDPEGRTVRIGHKENRLHLPIVELEAKAIYVALVELKDLVRKRHCRKIVVRTDSSNCVAVFASKNSSNPTVLHYLTRASEVAQGLEAEFSVEFVPGPQNPADDPSRLHEGKSADPWIVRQEQQYRFWTQENHRRRTLRLHPLTLEEAEKSVPAFSHEDPRAFSDSKPISSRCTRSQVHSA